MLIFWIYISACDFCEQPLNYSGVTSACECVIGDGFEKTIFSINRMIPAPSIQVCNVVFTQYKIYILYA